MEDKIFTDDHGRVWKFNGDGLEKYRSPADSFFCVHCGRCPKCGKFIDDHRREVVTGPVGYVLVCK